MALTRSASLVAVPDVLPTQERISSSILAMLGVNGMSQQQLAATVEMPQPMLNKALRNKRRMTLEETERIAKALDCPLPMLFEGGDEIRRRARAGIFGESESPDSPDGLGVSPSACDGEVIDFRARRTTALAETARSVPIAA